MRVVLSKFLWQMQWTILCLRKNLALEKKPDCILSLKKAMLAHYWKQNLNGKQPCRVITILISAAWGYNKGRGEDGRGKGGGGGEITKLQVQANNYAWSNHSLIFYSELERSYVILTRQFHNHFNSNILDHIGLTRLQFKAFPLLSTLGAATGCHMPPLSNVILVMIWRCPTLPGVSWLAI